MGGEEGERPGASFIKVAAHKKIAETGLKCAYAFFTANVGIYKEILCGKGCAILRTLSTCRRPPAKFFRHGNQRHPMIHFIPTSFSVIQLNRYIVNLFSVYF